MNSLQSAIIATRQIKLFFDAFTFLFLFLRRIYKKYCQLRVERSTLSVCVKMRNKSFKKVIFSKKFFFGNFSPYFFFKIFFQTHLLEVRFTFVLKASGLMLNLFLKYVESYIDYRLCFELPCFRRYSFHTLFFPSMLLELYATLLLLSIEPHRKKNERREYIK
jgi:hypothetical protein